MSIPLVVIMAITAFSADDRSGRSGSVENTYAGGHGGGVDGPVEADVGEEDWGLGAGEAVAIIALTAACGSEGGSG